MILNDVHQGIQKYKTRKRIGRGSGSGHGKTSGRGHKGFYSRSGAKRRLSFEGGQMPLARRIAKRGFNNNAFAQVIAIVGLDKLEKYYQAGETVNAATLKEKGIVKGRHDEIKILANGELTKKLIVQVNRISQGAEAKITAAGGTVELVVPENN